MTELTTTTADGLQITVRMPDNHAWVRESLETWPRALLVAAIYGVSIWLIMTWIVIPSMVHRPPTLSTKYWVQLIGHIPFVVGPMILVNRRGTRS